MTEVKISFDKAEFQKDFSYLFGEIDKMGTMPSGVDVRESLYEYASLSLLHTYFVKRFEDELAAQSEYRLAHAITDEQWREFVEEETRCIDIWHESDKVIGTFVFDDPKLAMIIKLASS